MAQFRSKNFIVLILLLSYICQPIISKSLPAAVLPRKKAITPALFSARSDDEIAIRKPQTIKDILFRLVTATEKLIQQLSQKITSSYAPV
jgi:hypothetical protein